MRITAPDPQHILDAEDRNREQLKIYECIAVIPGNSGDSLQSESYDIQNYQANYKKIENSAIFIPWFKDGIDPIL